jgi:FkbM family methyltransferase
MIPIVVICFNNHKYVDNTVQQLLRLRPELLKWIIILDNKSTDLDTIYYLQNSPLKVMHNSSNVGPWISPYVNADIYDVLPNKFIITDPDLQFNLSMPSNFIEIMLELSEKYNTEKIGFALDIHVNSSDAFALDIKHPNKEQTIREVEETYWHNKIEQEKNYDLYYAPIDTTFCLLNKANFENMVQIRMAGDFLAKHLPWYTNNPILTKYDELKIYSKTNNYDGNSFSTIWSVFKLNFDDKYTVIEKNEDFLLVPNRPEDPNFRFWTETYKYWEPGTFDVFNKYLNKNKVMIDIGGWIGTTAIYASHKAKHVYVVEADFKSIVSLRENCALNSKNITIIDRAVYNSSDSNVFFGKNQYLDNSDFNDSTSQIQIKIPGKNPPASYLMKTITLDEIINTYSINPDEISLIKVDIEGGEENILEDLFKIKEKYNVRLYISFHYNWWQNKDLDRFSFLTENQKDIIKHHQFLDMTF